MIIVGTPANDVLGPSPNTDLNGGDTVSGLGGDDLIRTKSHTTGSPGIYDGGDGNDTIFGAQLTVGDGLDTILGGGGDDEIVFYVNSFRPPQPTGAFIDGGSGRDTLIVKTNDRGTIDLSSGELLFSPDPLTTQPALARLINIEDVAVVIRAPEYGIFDRVTITGSDSANLLSSELSSRINGSAGADTIIGGAYNDTLSGDDGADTLLGQGGDDVLAGVVGSDLLAGGDGADTLDGGAGDDALFGGAGNDSLVGSDGFDQLFGGDGNDTIFGGFGVDNMHGGAGADLFVVGDAPGPYDGIFDFRATDGDKLGVRFIPGSPVNSPQILASIQLTDGVNTFLFLGNVGGVDQWVILVGTPSINASDIVAG